MKYYKLFLTIILLFLYSFLARAQTTINGVVVDESNNSPLPFANVMTDSGEGGITNEKGMFSFDVEKPANLLIISYVGYESRQQTLIEGKQFYPIKLRAASLKLTEVEILASDKNAATLLYAAIKNSRKLANSRIVSKVFRRTYSTINEGTPSELIEGFYNATLTDGGVFSFVLKNGRVGVPLENYILQLDLLKVLETYHFFGENAGHFPPTPLQDKSVRRILKKYYVRYAGSFLAEKDTIVQIGFESINKGSAFDGIVFINKNENRIIRVVHQIENAEHVPFYTVLNKNSSSLENMGLKWDTGFDLKNNVFVPKYMHIIMDIDYCVNDRRSPLKGNTKLFFYDYEQPFKNPIYGVIDDLNDYDKILSTPYNAEFWERASILPETGMEERFRRDLEANRHFVNDDLTSGNIGLLNQKFQLIQPGIVPDWGKVADSRKKTTYNTNIHSNLSTDNYNGLYAATFLALDYNCFPDTTQFAVQAVLSYDQSYMQNRNEQEGAFFLKFLELADLHAKEFENKLHEKYQEECPDESDLEKELKSAEKSMHKEIYRKLSGVNTRTKEYLYELDAMLNTRRKKL